MLLLFMFTNIKQNHLFQQNVCFIFIFISILFLIRIFVVIFNITTKYLHNFLTLFFYQIPSGKLLCNEFVFFFFFFFLVCLHSQFSLLVDQYVIHSGVDVGYEKMFWVGSFNLIILNHPSIFFFMFCHIWLILVQ